MKMAIVNMNCFPLPNFISNPSTNVAVKNSSLRSGAIPYRKQDFRLAAVAASTCCPQIDVEHLQRECGVTLTGIGDSCVVRMELENGSAANLMLPSGLITSFKPQMWHGGTMELLHTFVSQETETAVPVIQGGLSLALGCKNDATGISWSPNAWALHQVSGTPQESIQVELICTSEQGNAQVKHIITLKPDVLNSEYLVSNSSNTSSFHLTGSAICHLAVSTPDATYTVGLQGSDYFIRPPFEANFSIIPPDFKRTDQHPGKLNKLFSKWDARHWNADDDVVSLVREIREELVGEEQDNYKHLTQKVSRIYTSTPRSLTIIDRGRRNSVTVRRHGFKEVYLMSPGSEHEWYDKYSYICIGHASLLEPVILTAQTEWRGGLQLWNPNS